MYVACAGLEQHTAEQAHIGCVKTLYTGNLLPTVTGEAQGTGESQEAQRTAHVDSSNQASPARTVVQRQDTRHADTHHRTSGAIPTTKGMPLDIPLQRHMGRGRDSTNNTNNTLDIIRQRGAAARTQESSLVLHRAFPPAQIPLSSPTQPARARVEMGREVTRGLYTLSFFICPVNYSYMYIAAAWRCDHLLSYTCMSTIGTTAAGSCGSGRCLCTSWPGRPRR